MMINGYVYTRPKADQITLQGVIQRLQTELAYMVQTRIEDIAFNVLPNNHLSNFWTEGRAFGLKAEIRWQKVGPQEYNLIVLSEKKRNLGDGWTSQTYQVRVRKPGGGPLRVYLWGTWQPAMNGWGEVRIPRLLPYPITPPDSSKRHRIYVTAAEYAQNGMVRFIRWKKLRMEEV